MTSSLAPSADARNDSDSGSSTPSKRRLSLRPSLSIDLSKLPPPVRIPQATNTVLITNLFNPKVFETENQSEIRSMIETTASVHTWVPLKSFRRILASFTSTDEATSVRAAWDGANILGQRVRVFYGPNLSEAQFSGPQHLALPDAGKLFFISPPPSPPHGWEMRVEDSPNKLVHADDLVEALERLQRHNTGWENANIEMTPVDDDEAASIVPTSFRVQKRSRSSTLIYHPEEHGSSPNLPAIAVVNLCDEPDEELGPQEGEKGPRAIMASTSRPPLELANNHS